MAELNLQKDPEIAVETYINALLMEFPVESGGDFDEPLGVASNASCVNSKAVEIAARPIVDINKNTDKKDAISVVAVREKLAAKLSMNAGSDASKSHFVRHLERAQRSLGSVKRKASQLECRPEWAADVLCCLTFKVANLKLALPVESVSNIVPFAACKDAFVERCDSAELDVEADAPPWLLGHVFDAGKILELTGCFDEDPFTVVDTAKIVMPERYDDEMAKAYRMVLQLRDMSWGLAVDTVGGEVEYISRQIRWRGAHTRRTWLAGTVVEDMCAIVDADALNRVLLADTVLADSNSKT